MSRSYELRVYTLATAEALETYRQVHYPRHLISFLAYGTSTPLTPSPGSALL